MSSVVGNGFSKINQATELVELGFDEYLEEGGVAVIEWADRFAAALPARTRWVRFEIGDASERIISDDGK